MIEFGEIKKIDIKSIWKSRQGSIEDDSKTLAEIPDRSSLLKLYFLFCLVFAFLLVSLNSLRMSFNCKGSVIELPIHEKTDGKCHVCGQDVAIDKFEADHVKSHSKGGKDSTDNFLATCRTCNNYRWDYLPDEIRWILKIGIWTRKQIEDNTPLGQEIGRAFIEHENKRENRRKSPRVKID